MPLFITYQNKTLLSAPGAELMTCRYIPEKISQRGKMTLVTAKDFSDMLDKTQDQFLLSIPRNVPVNNLFLYLVTRSVSVN